MRLIRPFAIFGLLLVIGTVVALLLTGHTADASAPRGVAYESAQSVNPGASNSQYCIPTAERDASTKAHLANVRFFDVNNLPESESVLTTEAAAVHGDATIEPVRMPVVTTPKRANRKRTKTMQAWCYLCSRAIEEPLWRIHPNPVQMTLSSDGITPFEVTATDLREGRSSGTSLILQCIVCSKEQPIRPVAAPDRIPSVIGASEIRTLRIEPPLPASALIRSVNGEATDSARFISSPRAAVVEARVRNLPAGTHVYLLAQPFDDSRRWVSMLQPQNSLAGDKFVGTAVLGSKSWQATDNFQKFWLSVIVSHQPLRPQPTDASGQTLPVSEADWEQHYAPMLQPISSAPIMVKRLPQQEEARVTLDLEGAETGFGSINGAPIEVGRYFSAFGGIDFPGGMSNAAMAGYHTWLLVYPEPDFGKIVSGGGKGPVSATNVQAEAARVDEGDWSLPWATVNAPGRYIVVAVVTRSSSAPPEYITDPSVCAVSEPKLIEYRSETAK